MKLWPITLSGRLLRPATIGLALLVEVLAAAFFVVDSLTELAMNESKLHPMTELPVAIALCIGAWFTIKELRSMLRRAEEQDRALAQASSAFLTVVQAKFELWRLTPSERDVAWLTLKGFDLSDIAAKRGSASGTVRAQLARIYDKSGVTNRAGFVALFVDDLTSRLPESAPL